MAVPLVGNSALGVKWGCYINLIRNSFSHNMKLSHQLPGSPGTWKDILSMGTYNHAPGRPGMAYPHIWQREVIHDLSLPVLSRSFAMFFCAEMRKHWIIIKDPDEGGKMSQISDN